MSFLQPLMLIALPLIALPIIIHLINQWRYQTKQWGAMMFLLAANRMNRGFAKLRQYLILAMRTLAVAGLLFAVARPLASGLLGMSGGGSADTTIVLMDRSPSMQEQGPGGLTKIETGRRQLSNALEMLGSKQWVTIDAASLEAVSFEALEALVESPALTDASAMSDLPGMLQSALEYLQINKSGPTEVWICSDLRAADWNAESGSWAIVRDAFSQLPQSVRFHLLAYSDAAESNVAVRVTEVKRDTSETNGVIENALLLSMQFSRTEGSGTADPVLLPVQIEIDGTRTELEIEFNGAQADLRNQRIALPRGQKMGWGKVSIPADSNLADNDYYFVFADEPVRRIVVVSEDRAATRALEIAASVSAAGESNTTTVEVIAPDQVDSLVLDDAALLLWQTSLPDAQTAPSVENYVNSGGQVIFFPPSSLIASSGISNNEAFLGVRWGQWLADENVMVENWRGDQDLLAATLSGGGLPVSQLRLSGYATLEAEVELSKLATVSGAKPLIAKVPSSRGGVYFFTASADPQSSTLAESGVVLFVAIQRAIEQGQNSLGFSSQRVAAASEESTGDWQQLSGSGESLSTEFAMQSGVYRQGERLFAVNRDAREDQRTMLADTEVSQLFEGLQFSRVDDNAGNLSGIVREVWRVFLILMILALIVEAALCLPRPIAGRKTAMQSR